MTPLPGWVDFESAERSAATMARGLSGASDAWGRLLAHAQAVLGSRTDTRDAEQQASYDFDDWKDLVAAGRILDSAATELGLSDPDNRSAAAVLAACAFGMAGSAVSAAAVIRNHQLLYSGLSPSELATIALSSPGLSREVYPFLPPDSKQRTCIENVTAYLATGADERLDVAARALDESIQEEANPWEGYLLRLSRLSLAHARRLAVAKVLEEQAHLFPSGYLNRLVDDSPMLLPSQYEAITKHGILSFDRNILIALPTGTGKTLLGELALLGALGQQPGLVCYIAPYVALGRQVAEKIDRHTPREIRVHGLMGGYQEPEPLHPETHPEVVVATPERFDAMIRIRPELLSWIRCIVFDEAHMIGNGQRGVRLEGLLTRLRLAAERGGQIPRIILLSAVLSNADALANWIGIAPENIIRGTWRPSAKRLLRWTEDGVLRLHAGDDPLRTDPFEVLGETRLPWPNRRFYPVQHYGDINRQEPLAVENIAFLADYEYNQYQQPVLCVCSTRPKTRHLASKIAQRFKPLEPVPPTIKAITDLLDEKYKYLRPLKDALESGVAYHNSSLPHDVRQSIEKAVEDRALKVVAATTTLAEGVDLPFRVTVLADWLIFDGERSSPMESLLFKNIAGRCGRAGQFTEGDTVIFDNPVGDAHLTSPARRPSLQNEVFFPDSQPMLTSAIGRLDRQTAVSTIGSQLLAAIRENPEVDDVHSKFVQHSFAYRSAQTTLVRERTSAAYGEILDESQGEPLAIVASPAQLTPLGRAVSDAGLSPATARKLLSTLNELRNYGSSRADLVAINAILLKSLADVVEQTNPDLRKAVANPRSRPIVRADELSDILNLWLGGSSLETIFASLPSKQQSNRKPKLQTWFEGITDDSSWTDQFAKFHDFVNQCMEFFLPWILRSARSLSEVTPQPDRPWNEWARFTELGVDNMWSVRLITERVIPERELARSVGERLESITLDAISPGQLEEALIDVIGNDYQTINRVINLYIQAGVQTP